MELRHLILPVLIVLCYNCVSAQHTAKSKNALYVPANKALYDTIAKQDSLLFAAFNSRNIDQFSQYFKDDMQYVDDNDWLTYTSTINAFKKLFSKNRVLTRRLVMHSLHVGSINDFVIESGKHVFCQIGQHCDTFKFQLIWEKKNGEWKLFQISFFDNSIFRFSGITK